MPYAKRKYTKRVRRVPYGRKPRTTRAIRRVVKRTVMRLAETKYADTAQPTNVTASTGVISLLVTINNSMLPDVAQGLLHNNRTGDKILHIRTKNQWQINAVLASGTVGTFTNTGTQYRFLILAPRKGVNQTQMLTYLATLTSLTDIFQELDREIVRVVKERKMVKGVFYDGVTDNVGEGLTHNFTFSYLDKKRRTLQYDQSSGASLGQLQPYNKPFYSVFLGLGTNNLWSWTTKQQNVMTYKDM